MSQENVEIRQAKLSEVPATFGNDTKRSATPSIPKSSGIRD